MPGTYYMGNDFRHDHALRVPRPDLSVKYGTPNACNKCHTDRPASWAASAVRKWYGPIRAYHFSEDLIEASKANATSERHIVRLINDTATPAIIKATALHYLKDIPTQGSLGLLLKGLSHPDAQVRYRALRSLANFPSETWLSAAASLLSDKVRAVRIAAADLFITVPSTQIPAEYYTAYTSAKTELEKYVLHQSDFASGNVMAGDYYLKLQDYTNAERFYLRSLKKDTALNYARLNLSVVYNLSGKNQEALKVLQQALKTDPKNDRIYFNLALLYNEMHNKAKAKECLASAVALHSQNPRVYYNYGLMLQMEGRLKEALVQLEKAVQLSPRDGDLNYALCLGYLQSGQKGKARQVASVLKQYYAGNSEYDKVIQQLGL
jgi:tetratricopeptide (TPR) repeat protein